MAKSSVPLAATVPTAGALNWIEQVGSVSVSKANDQMQHSPESAVKYAAAVLGWELRRKMMRPRRLAKSLGDKPKDNGAPLPLPNTGVATKIHIRNRPGSRNLSGSIGKNKRGKSKGPKPSLEKRETFYDIASGSTPDRDLIDPEELQRQYEWSQQQQAEAERNATIPAPGDVVVPGRAAGSSSDPIPKPAVVTGVIVNEESEETSFGRFTSIYLE